jgi:hypothetical protein
MNPVTTWLFAAVAGVFVVAVVVALWEHFQHIDDLRRQLDGSEESRFSLEHRAGVVEARLDALVQTVGARHRAAAAVHEIDARRAVLDQALSRMTAPAGAAASSAATAASFEGNPWAETEPLVALGPTPSLSRAYADTMPAELADLVPSLH